MCYLEGDNFLALLHAWKMKKKNNRDNTSLVFYSKADTFLSPSKGQHRSSGLISLLNKETDQEMLSHLSMVTQ